MRYSKMIFVRAFVFAVCSLILYANTVYASDYVLKDNRQFLNLGGYEQGVAHARVLLKGDGLVMEVLTPAYNIHTVEVPKNVRTKAEQEQVDAAIQKLMSDPNRYLSFSPASACSLQSAKWQSELAELNKTRGQQHYGKNWLHTNLRIEYQFKCSASPKEMVVELFSLFPRLREISVQLISNEAALRRITLRPSTPVLVF